LPYRAKKPCMHSHCTKLVTGAYCSEHKPKDKRPGIYDRVNYGPEWKQIRNKYLIAHPRCERCGAKATQVHHRLGVARGHEEKNLEALCQRCHSRETATRGRGGSDPWS
jgi:5-methylcytosine-specific restriction enzyme A